MKQSDKIRRVMWGREEHPLTVFVPWDCGHHCPFCTTKREYEQLYPEERLEQNFDRLKESMRRILEYRFVDEVVFTGGEPLADVERLEELIGLVGDRRVYVNTSLNLDERKTEMAIRFLVRASTRNLNGEAGIDGISVSFPYANVKMVNACGFQTLKTLLAKMDGHHRFNWCRINSVVRGNETPEQIRTFLSDLSGCCCPDHGWDIWSVNLRKDYTTCDQSNLNDCCDSTMQTLMSMPDLHYAGHGGCLVCRNDVFNLDEQPEHGLIPRLTYHRGVENTSIRYGDFLVINDLVIKPDGEIRYDWRPGTPLPKRVMDALGRKEPCEAEPEWKWKNPLFASKLTIGGSVGAIGCRDAPYERCGA